MRLYNKIYHRADKVKKARGDSLVPLLLPSLFGIFICTVCVCGMTWAWYSAGVDTPTQKLTAAYYEVAVVSVTGTDGSEIKPDENGSYSLTSGTAYRIELAANGTVKECGGYCIIQNGAGELTYTQTFKPSESITVQFIPKLSGNYTFSGVWGSLPAGTENHLHHTDATKAAISDDHIFNEPVSDDMNAPAETEPADGTYTVQPGDTLSGIAKKFNTTIAKLQAYNGIEGIEINAGQSIKIPPENYEITETTATQESEASPEISPETTEPSVTESSVTEPSVTEPSVIEPATTTPETTVPPATSAPEPASDVTTENTEIEKNSNPGRIILSAAMPHQQNHRKELKVRK